MVRAHSFVKLLRVPVSTCNLALCCQFEFEIIQISLSSKSDILSNCVRLTLLNVFLKSVKHANILILRYCPL